LASYEGNSTYASSGAGFTETIQNLPPTISSLSPSVTAAGGAGFTLQINGSNYFAGATAMWGSTALTTTYVNATQLTALVPAALIASAGSAEVTVTSLGGALASAPATFTIAPSSTFPLLLSLSADSTTAGGPQFTLTVDGANFAANAVVLWNGSERATQYVSSTQLTATILATDIKTQGTDLVTVVNPAPIAATSAALPFAVRSSTPVATITSASLTDTADGNGNYALTLTGTNFVPGSTVLWNGNSLTTTYASPYQIMAVVPTADYLLLPVVV